MSEDTVAEATDESRPPAPSVTAETGSAGQGRFPIDLPAFQGSLEELTMQAQRGDIDLATIPIAEITADYRHRLRGDTPAQLRDQADFMALAARLVRLKAQAMMPADDAVAELEEEPDPATDAGRRLAEYRLYKAAAEALLTEPSEEGARSFLAMVTPEVIAIERLRIPPERLVAAFRAVLERLAAVETPTITAITYSVLEMAARLRQRLQRQPRLSFDELFSEVSSRLEAVALFLGLLELLRGAEAEVLQTESLGPITVVYCGA